MMGYSSFQPIYNIIIVQNPFLVNRFSTHNSDFPQEVIVLSAQRYED